MSALSDLLARVEVGAISTDLITAAFGSLWDDMLVLGAFDGSLDAAKALHDAVMPHHDVDLELRHGIHDVLIYDVPGVQSIRGTSIDSPARAWLIAILRALASGGAA